MAELKTNVMRILERGKISFTPHAYESGDGAIDGVSVAGKLGLDPAAVYKTLVTRGGPPDGYFVFVIPVAEELDLKKAAAAAGVKSVRMLPLSELTAVTGYVRGGCSPVGMKKKYPVRLDESDLARDTILVSAGRIGSQVELAPADLLRAAGGKTAPLTAE